MNVETPMIPGLLCGTLIIKVVNQKIGWLVKNAAVVRLSIILYIIIPNPNADVNTLIELNVKT